MSKLLTDRARILPVLLVAVVIAVGATLVIVLAGGSSGGAGSTPTPPSAGVTGGKGKTVTVDISMFAYHPSSLTIAPGTTVAFHNVDTTEHTATADAGGAFDTGAIEHDQTKTITLTKAGTYGYHCSFHPFMTGTIIVK